MGYKVELVPPKLELPKSRYRRNPRHLMVLGRRSLSGGEYQMALRYFKMIMRQNPENRLARIYYCRTLDRMGF